MFVGRSVPRSRPGFQNALHSSQAGPWNLELELDRKDMVDPVAVNSERKTSCLLMVVYSFPHGSKICSRQSPKPQEQICRLQGRRRRRRRSSIA